MNKYSIDFAPRTEDQLAIIPKAIRIKILDKIKKLADDPRPRNVEPLEGNDDGLYRVRQGDYRVVYAINDKRLLVLIVRIVHRKEVYKKKHTH